MPAPRPFITLSQLHLVGLLIDDYHDAHMAADGWTDAEREAATALHTQLDAYLTDRLGADWNDKEVL